MAPPGALRPRRVEKTRPNSDDLNRELGIIATIFIGSIGFMITLFWILRVAVKSYLRVSHRVRSARNLNSETEAPELGVSDST